MEGTGTGTLPGPVVLLRFSSITISKEFFYIGQKLTEESVTSKNGASPFFLPK